MNRRIARTDDTTPTLFPFLAVLICTMGAIIVLLVLVVKQADVQARQATETSQENLDEQRQAAKDRLAVVKNRVELLQSLRPDLKKRLEKERSLRGHLADHTTRLQQELEDLKSELEALADPSTEKQPTMIQGQIDDLEQKIADAKKELELKQSELAQRKKTYAIIPKSGNGNGTFRRPIFVECSADGVTLQPYGIQLNADDFPNPLSSGNPLDVALLLIRDYWNQIDPNQASGQPYPLFVVRPNGRKAFAAARKAMKSWVDEFGYELVPDEIELKFPEADSGFRQRLAAAVEDARAKQQLRIAAINRTRMLQSIRRLDSRQGESISRNGSGTNSLAAGNRRGGYRASPITGGFVQDPATANSSTSQFASSSFRDSGSRSGPSTQLNPGTPFSPTGKSGLPSGEQNGNRDGYPGTISELPPVQGGGANPVNGDESRNPADQATTPNVDSNINRNSAFQGGNPQTARNAGSNNQDDSARPQPQSILSQANSQTQQGQSGAQSSQSTGQSGMQGGDRSSAASASAGNGQPSESLAINRGNNWALPSKSRNAIQVRKPIKVLLGKNSLQIMEIGKGIKEIPFENSTASAVPSLVEQVWKHIDAWGIAGINSYWKPDLHFYVSPEADGRFDDLKNLLSESGLDVRRIR